MNLKHILLWSILALFSTSCVQRKHLLHLNDAGISSEVFNVSRPEYRIQPGDILHVQILTIDQALQQFSDRQILRQESTVSTEAGIYLTGFIVNDSGYVNLPLIGNVYVNNSTIMEINKAILYEVNKYYRDAAVDVKLLSYRFTVLGEVTRPGTYINYHDRLNIFEAIARAGNLTDIAAREVLLIRTRPEGTTTVRLDLSQASILSSEYFYLLPNDMIIADPAHGKAFKLYAPVFTVGLSALSTLFLIINLFIR